jgi:hypothetical protein
VIQADYSLKRAFVVSLPGLIPKNKSFSLFRG